MLPFDLPHVTRGRAELTPAAAEAGSAAAQVAGAALSAQLGFEVRISGRALPGHGTAGCGCAQLGFDLPALPGTASLELDATLVAAVVDRMAGGPGDAAAASEPTPLEAAALELLALVALEAVSRREDVERALSPRLTRACAPPASPLAVALEVDAGGRRGRGRLLLPPSAVRALRGSPLVPAGLADVAIACSLRSGSASLDGPDADALGPGDVLVLDAAPGASGALVVPGGFRAGGRIADAAFHVEETSMTETTAAMPIPVEVELARVPVTLADLARLEPGAVLPLPVDRSGRVVLRVGERALARGELVDVDGAVGVRILSLEGRP